MARARRRRGAAARSRQGRRHGPDCGRGRRQEPLACLRRRGSGDGGKPGGGSTRIPRRTARVAADGPTGRTSPPPTRRAPRVDGRRDVSADAHFRRTGPTRIRGRLDNRSHAQRARHAAPGPPADVRPARDRRVARTGRGPRAGQCQRGQPGTYGLHPGRGRIRAPLVGRDRRSGGRPRRSSRGIDGTPARRDADRGTRGPHRLDSQRR